MPYITKVKRERIDWIIDNLIAELDDSGFIGSLNYTLFRMAKQLCFRYRDYAEFFGELESAKAEIYRRLVAPYENEKIKENGDV